MKKRLLSMFLITSMVIGMAAGCGQNKEAASETANTAEAAETTGEEAGGAEDEETDKASEEAGDTEGEDLSEEEAWKSEPAYGQTLTITGGAANCVSAVVVADILGFMEEEGLEVEWERIGSTEAMNAVAAGKADFVTGC